MPGMLALLQELVSSHEATSEWYELISNRPALRYRTAMTPSLITEWIDDGVDSLFML